LIPLPLVFTVILCSGLFWISSFRDALATGKPILDMLGILWGQDDADANLLQYTKSTEWFDGNSRHGGLSAVRGVTTDANNMGGLFVRKMAGVAGLAFHTTKIWPIVFQSSLQVDHQTKRWTGSSWGAGHFDLLLIVGLLGDLCVSVFYLTRLEELKDANAQGLAMAYILASSVEAFIFGLYVFGRKMGARTKRTTPQRTESSQAHDPSSLPSRIVARTVLIVSSAIGLIAARDVFFPGRILPYIPRDDIYLEWTGAFLHSPPPDTIEADQHGLEALLFAGDKFAAQLLGTYLLLGCACKFASAWAWSKGGRRMGGIEHAEGSGVVASKMIWKAQALGDMLILGMLRMFTPAAKSASLDLRWHLMLVAYEMFILLMYAFF